MTISTALQFNVHECFARLRSSYIGGLYFWLVGTIAEVLILIYISVQRNISILWKLRSPQSALSKAVLKRFVCMPNPIRDFFVASNLLCKTLHVRCMLQMDKQ